MSNENKPDNVDRIEFRLPFGMGFSVSGRNASKLFWAVGVIGIIIALGWAVANVIGAWHGNSNQLSHLDGNRSGSQHSPDLPRWCYASLQTHEHSLQNAGGNDRDGGDLRWFYRV